MITAGSWPRRVRVTTTDVDEACEWNRAHYVANRVHLLEPPGRFALSHALIDCGPFTVARVEISVALRVLTDPTDYVAVCEVLRGQRRAQFDGCTIATPEGGLALLPSGMPLEREWAAGTVRRLVRLPAAAVAAVLGCDPPAILYEGIQPRSVQAARSWMSLIRHVTRSVLPTGTAGGSELLLDTTGRLLLATLLETFPISSPMRVTSVWGAEAVVARAKRFIEDNAHRPIGIPEIAAGARVSPTWLGQAFRQRLQMTPMGYLWRVRMDGAHTDLKAAEPTKGDTVSEIATRWGFAHGGRFAAQYRKWYGCPPSDTLRA